MQITLTEANTLLQQLVGLPISLPWKGYGSAIFFELGQLSPSTGTRAKWDEGEANISIEWDWRVEAGAKILYGSSNSRPRIVRGIERLQGETVEQLFIHGEVPEITIVFSNGQKLVTAAMATGDPEWYVRLQDSRWIRCEAGVISVGENVCLGLTEEEEIAFRHAEETATRWGVPVGEKMAGRCSECHWFTLIDGEAELSDYGVCTSSLSPFDGRAVNVSSGCDAFLDQEAAPSPA